MTIEGSPNWVWNDNAAEPEGSGLFSASHTVKKW